MHLSFSKVLLRIDPDFYRSNLLIGLVTSLVLCPVVLALLNNAIAIADHPRLIQGVVVFVFAVLAAIYPYSKLTYDKASRIKLFGQDHRESHPQSSNFDYLISPACIVALTFIKLVIKILGLVTPILICYYLSFILAPLGILILYFRKDQIPV